MKLNENIKEEEEGVKALLCFFYLFLINFEKSLFFI
jgi:hypothetical protein